MAKKRSAKKRTPAQIAATKKLVAMNKKKRASKKRAAKKRATRITPRRRPTTRVRGYSPRTGRKRNPAKGANKWSGSHHVVKFVPANKARPLYVSGLNREGSAIHFTETRNAAALFALGSAQTMLYLARKKAEESGWTGHMEIDSYHFEAWN